MAWRDLAANRWLSIGTNNKLYVTVGGTVADVTPRGFVPGRADSLYGLGFGAGDYGKAAYGTYRPPGS